MSKSHDEDARSRGLSESSGFEPVPAHGRRRFLEEGEEQWHRHQVRTSAIDETECPAFSVSDDISYGSGAGNDDSMFHDDTVPMIASLPHSIYNPNGTSTLYTVFLIVNAALGAGLLNFPKAFDSAGGIAVATGVQAVLMIFIIPALLILANSADRSSGGGAATLQDTLGGACGRIGKMITSIIIVVYCFGTTITFLIIIGDQFDRALASLYGDDFCNLWYMSRPFTMSASAILFILPMCYSQKIDFLKLPSALGVFAILYLTALIVYEYYAGGHGEPGPIKHTPDRWTDLFLVVPQVCFGYQCHVSVIPIYSCMKHRTIKHFASAAVTAIVVCMVSYTFSASYGYLTFGSFVKEDIMMSYSAKRPEVMAGIIALTLKTITTYPILLFCGREGLKSILSEGHRFFNKSEGQSPPEASSNGIDPPLITATSASSSSTPAFLVPGTRSELAIRVGFVSLWFTMSLVLAIKIPNIGEVISLLGSMAAIFIFVFPGLCLFKISYRADPAFVRKMTWVKVITSFVFLGLGGFIFGVVITQSVQGIINNHHVIDSGNHTSEFLREEPFALMIRRKTCVV